MRHERMHRRLLVMGLVGLAAGVGCLFADEEETPAERRIVLQLDINPNQLKFQLGAPEAEAAGTADPAAKPGAPPAPEASGEAVAAPTEPAGKPPRKKTARPDRSGPGRTKPPRSGPSLEGLLMRIERVKLERARRGFKPGELPAVDQALARADRLLDSDRLSEASQEVAKAQRALDNFQIDRQYIERRLELLNRDPRVSNLSGETLKKVSALLDGVNRAYLQGDYRKANKIIEKIRKIIGAK